MTTLGSVPARKGPNWSSIIVIASISGAVMFGGYYGYLAWANDSFPAQVKPFADYANVTSWYFNGTEFAYHVEWLNSGYLPEFAQLTSPDTDAANSPVCNVGVTSVQDGQVLFMPFALGQPSGAVQDASLSIAVKNLTSGAEFTIVYNIANATAENGDIQPVSQACYEPAGVE